MCISTISCTFVATFENIKKIDNIVMMKRFLIATTLGLTMALGVYAQGMSDQQVLAFIGSEVKAGTSQAQIVKSV